MIVAGTVVDSSVGGGSKFKTYTVDFVVGRTFLVREGAIVDSYVEDTSF